MTSLNFKLLDLATKNTVRYLIIPVRRPPCMTRTRCSLRHSPPRSFFWPSFFGLFPQNFKKQLSLIFDAVGSPQPHEVAHIRNPEAIRFLESMQGRVKV